VGEEEEPPSPRGLIEAKCQYRGEGGKPLLSVAPPPHPRAARGPPLVLEAKGRQFTSMSHCSNYVCPGVDGRRGESCFSQASRRALLPPRSGFVGGHVGISRLVAARVLTRGCD
jgi:hypothetical protein